MSCSTLTHNPRGLLHIQKRAYEFRLFSTHLTHSVQTTERLVVKRAAVNVPHRAPRLLTLVPGASLVGDPGVRPPAQDHGPSVLQTDPSSGGAEQRARHLSERAAGFMKLRTDT